MKKIITTLCLLFLACTLAAQETAYDRMKAEVNENSLPLINISVDINTINRADYVEGRIEITDFLKRTQNETTVDYRCLIRYRGATSLAYEKKSFAVKLIDVEGDDLDVNIFGIRKENSWILDAMAVDRTRMRNRVCFDIWNEMNRLPYGTKYESRNGTEGVFAELFLNGEYHGLYCMSDKIDRKLLGLEKTVTDNEGNTTVRGLLYKGITWGNAIYLTQYNDAPVDKTVWNAWELSYPDKYPSLMTWAPLMELIDFCGGSTDFANEYRNYFDTKNLIDYMVFTNALYVRDNGYKNTYVSTTDITNGHLFVITPWDMDTSLGGDWNGAYYDLTADMDRYHNTAPFHKLYPKNIDGFADDVKKRWEELSHTTLSPDELERRLRTYAKQFEKSGAWQREREKWNGNPVPLTETPGEELEYVTSWYQSNYSGINSQLSDKPNAIGRTEAPKKISTDIFTLDGRKVAPEKIDRPPKGIYIKDGKKIIVNKY